MKGTTNIYIHVFRFLVIVTSIFMNAACNRNVENEREAAFSNLVGLQNLNTKLRLRLEKTDPIGEGGGDGWYLLIINQSSDFIWFSKPDDGLRLFCFDQKTGTWAEQVNEEEYLFNSLFEGVLVGPKNSDVVPDYDVIYFLPALKPDECQNGYRVFVSGVVFKNDEPTDVRVGSFMDVEIE